MCRFSKLRIEGSVNIPCSSEELNVKGNKKSEIGFIQRPEMAVLYSNKGKIIVIIGEEMKLTSEVIKLNMCLYNNEINSQVMSITKLTVFL